LNKSELNTTENNNSE